MLPKYHCHSNNTRILNTPQNTRVKTDLNCFHFFLVNIKKIKVGEF